MTYTVYWKKKTEETWHKITSNSPITWNQQIIPATQPIYPFTGGQCPPPIAYRITYELRSRTSAWFNCGPWSNWAPQSNLIPSALYYGPISSPQVVIGGVSGNSNFDRSISFAVTYHNSSGTKQTGYLNLGGSSGRLYASNCGPSWEYRNFAVSRIDGGLDNCGNPAPTTPGSPEKCKTTFSTGLVVEDAICIEVRTKPPGCECCDDLMPKATRILGMLP